MNFFKNYIYILLILIITFNCKELKNNHLKSELKYCSSLIINQTKNEYLLIPSDFPNQELIISKNNIPLKKCIISSASFIAYFKALNLEQNIIGVFEPENFYSKDIHHLIKQKKIMDLGSLNNMNIEKILKINPDIFITYYNPNDLKNIEILKNNGIKVLLLNDYLEKNPLGKAEIIKIFGILFSKNKQANDIFNKIEKNYIHWKNKANNQKNKPIIMSKIMYGDIWFVPQRESFVANFYKDAGGKYIFDYINGNNSEKLSFEQVLYKAKNADLWLDLADINSKQTLLIQNKNYVHFDCFNKNRMYSAGKRKNNKGANDFYEQANLYVDSILMDYISIIHPKILPNYNQKFMIKI